MEQIEKAVISFKDVSPDRNFIPVPTMLPIKVVSDKTGLRYEFLRQLCLKGEIVCIRTGKKYLINYEKLVEYLNTNTEAVR